METINERNYIDRLYSIVRHMTWLKKSKNMRSCLVTTFKIGQIISEFFRKRSVIQNIAQIPIEVIQLDGYKNTFCGYYDVSPFNPDNPNKLLLHCNNFGTWIKPTTRRATDLVLYDRISRQVKILASTRAWNWQQGSRLQWIDAEHVVYNSLQCELNGILMNVNTGEKQVLPANVNIAFRDQYIVSIDYSALTAGSEYGYPGLVPERNGDQIKRYFFSSATTEVLFSTRELHAQLAVSGAIKRHINHILINPGGDKFVFIYRFWKDGVRFDSLILYDFTTGIFRVIIENECVSHYAWHNNNTLFIWGAINGIGGYYWIDTNMGRIWPFINCDDGHPNFVNGRTVITDIRNPWYKAGLLRLYLQDVQNLTVVDLMVVSHPTIFNIANRCDMHVSLSFDKQVFQVDSRHLGYRCVIVGDLRNFRGLQT